MITKKNILILLAGILVAGAAVGGYVIWRNSVIEKDKIATAEAARDRAENGVRREAQTNLASLEKNAPAESATNEDKANYYNQVATLKTITKDYKGVIVSYLKLTELNGETPLAADIYMNAAIAYHRTGDTTTALALLDKAGAVLMTVNDEDYKTFALQDVAALRSEFSE